MSHKKIVEPQYVSVLCEELHHRDAKIVFTNGVFDLLHPGHVHYLAESRRLGTHLFVALNTDASVQRLKGNNRPLIPLVERLEVLASFTAVSYLTWFEEDTPAQIIRQVRPEVLVKGGDWQLEHIVGREFVESYGGSVVSIPFVNGYSTTNIVEKICQTTDN